MIMQIAIHEEMKNINLSKFSIDFYIYLIYN